MGTTARYNSKLKWNDFIRAGVIIGNDDDRRPDGFCMCNCGERAKVRWASSECSARLLALFGVLKGNGSTIRAEVLKRDKGICAVCAMDTEAEREKCAWWPKWDDETPDDKHQAKKAEVDALRGEYMRAGFPSPSKSWWEADHIIEVVRGGGMCGLDNLQTLCCACHKRKTKQLAQDRAEARRAIKSRGQSRLALVVF